MEKMAPGIALYFPRNFGAHVTLYRLTAPLLTRKDNGKGQTKLIGSPNMSRRVAILVILYFSGSAEQELNV